MISIDHQHDYLLYKILHFVTLIQYRYMYVHVVFDVNCIEIKRIKKFFEKCVASLCFQLHMISHPRYDNVLLSESLN